MGHGLDMDFYYLRDLQSSFSFHSWVNLTSLFLLRPLSLARIFASFHPLWYTRHVSSVSEVLQKSLCDVFSEQLQSGTTNPPDVREHKVPDYPLDGSGGRHRPQNTM